MQLKPLLSSLALVLAGTSLLAGPPDSRIVTALQTEVRAGPSFSQDCYVTNILRRGEPVEVIHDAGNGWLAIKPPRGSFSWIDTRHVQQVAPGVPNYAVNVEGAGAPVLVGSLPNVYRRPTKVNAHLPRGYQVRRIGQEINNPIDVGGSLICIEPPVAELRYVRAENLGKAPSATLMAGSSGVGGFVTASQRGGDAPPPPTTAPDPHALWSQAELAERRGRLREAIQLYKMAGSANASVNPARSVEAFNRARDLEDALNRPQSQGGFIPGPRSAATTRPAAPAQTVAATPPVTYVSAPAAPESSGTQLAVLRTALTTENSSQPWTGTLHRVRQGDAPYVLETGNKEMPVLYLMPHGVDLNRHVGKPVEVQGSFLYSSDARAHVLMVVHVRPLS